jgi:hypothetical protein
MFRMTMPPGTWDHHALGPQHDDPPQWGVQFGLPDAHTGNALGSQKDGPPG